MRLSYQYFTKKALIFNLSMAIQIKKASDSSDAFFVAETGLEPVTFGL